MYSILRVVNQKIKFYTFHPNRASFLIYINYLYLRVLSSNGPFANDCIVYFQITNDSNAQSLRYDFDSVSRWCDKWQTEFNVNERKYRVALRPDNTCRSHHIETALQKSVSSCKHLWCIQLITRDKADEANHMLDYLERNSF